MKNKIIMVVMVLFISIAQLTAFAIEDEVTTSEGNLSLIGEVSNFGGDDIQFLTLQSKNGNYFYLVIDRVTDDVYFMNLVDETDLFALVDEVPVEEIAELEITSIQEIEPQEEIFAVEKVGNSSAILALVFVAILIIIVAVWYVKTIKSKQTPKATSYLDEYEFDDDEEIIELENIEFVDDEIK
ncbi:MAG: DUF4366 domain-containing protein [Clostridia bacterium]